MYAKYAISTIEDTEIRTFNVIYYDYNKLTINY